MDFNALIKRSINLVIRPEVEWDKIEQENASIGKVILGFLTPYLFAIVIATITGSMIFSFGWLSIPRLIVSVFVSIIVPTGGILVSALIINALAPSFGSVQNIGNALKLVIYSYTAFFIVTIINALIPILFFVSIAGLYSIYIFWIGFVPMMKAPDSKKIGFAILCVLIVISVYSVISVATGFLFASLFISNAAYLMF